MSIRQRTLGLNVGVDVGSERQVRTWVRIRGLRMVLGFRQVIGQVSGSGVGFGFRIRSGCGCRFAVFGWLLADRRMVSRVSGSRAGSRFRI